MRHRPYPHRRDPAALRAGAPARPAGRPLSAGWVATLEQAIARQRAGDLRAARDLYRQAAEVSPDPTPARLLGLLLADAGDGAGALLWARRALALDPGAAQSHAALGRILAGAGQIAAAAAAFAAAVRLAPDMAAARLGLGQALLAGGDARAACEQFSAALRLRPLDGAARRGGAAALAACGDVELAAAMAAAHPDAGEIRHACGQALFRAGRPADAAGELARATALLAGDAAVRHDLGTALHEAGQPEAALPVYLAALALDPERVETWHNLGSVRQALGDLSGALAAYGTAVRLEPGCFARVAQELAAGRHGQVWLRAGQLRQALAAAAADPASAARAPTR